MTRRADPLEHAIALTPTLNGYAPWLDQLKRRIDTAQQRSARDVMCLSAADFKLLEFMRKERQTSPPSIEQSECELGGS